MSDLGRKGLGDQVQEKVTPDSQKSTLDKASENASGAYDKAASALQPGTLLISAHDMHMLTECYRGQQVCYPEGRRCHPRRNRRRSEPGPGHPLFCSGVPWQRCPVGPGHPLWQQEIDQVA